MSYLLTKSKLDVYDLQNALDYYKSHPEIKLYWTVPKYVNGGDILFIGQSGEKAGIYAVAIVTSSPVLIDIPDDNFWVIPVKARKPAWMTPIESLTVKPHPVLEPLLRKFPELEQVAKWLHSQGAVRYLTDEEGAAILRFV